jgi:hypothetical protein
MSAAKIYWPWAPDAFEQVTVLVWFTDGLAANRQSPIVPSVKPGDAQAGVTPEYDE